MTFTLFTLGLAACTTPLDPDVEIRKQRNPDTFTPLTLSEARQPRTRIAIDIIKQRIEFYP
jgi:hypothetical protein